MICVDSLRSTNIDEPAVDYKERMGTVVSKYINDFYRIFKAFVKWGKT